MEKLTEMRQSAFVRKNTLSQETGIKRIAAIDQRDKEINRAITIAEAENNIVATHTMCKCVSLSLSLTVCVSMLHFIESNAINNGDIFIVENGE